MSRAISPVVAVPILVGIAVLLAAAVGALAFGAPLPTADRPVALSVTATADTGRVVVVHEGGPPIDVREVRVRVIVDGTPLAEQPPLPFFAAPGFRSAPTGAFNPSADPILEPGERASFRVAGTNSPSLAEGATLTLRLYRDGNRIAAVEVRVR